jgi:hypothetical protein
MSKNLPMILLAIGAAAAAFFLVRKRSALALIGGSTQRALEGATTAQGALAALETQAPIAVGASAPVVTAAKRPATVRNPLTAIKGIGVGAKPTIAQSIGASNLAKAASTLSTRYGGATSLYKTATAAPRPTVKATPAPRKTSLYGKLKKVGSKASNAYTQVAGSKLTQLGASAAFGPQAGVGLAASSALLKRR